DLFANNLAQGGVASWRPGTGVTGATTVQLAGPVMAGVADLREPIEHGQRVAMYRLEGRVGGAWRELSRGTTIGYRRLVRFEPVRLDAVRVMVDAAVEQPMAVEIGL